MRYALVTLLAMTATVTTAAIAQDGSGHIGPKLPVIITPQPVPTTASPTVPRPKLLQSKLRSTSMRG